MTCNTDALSRGLKQVGGDLARIAPATCLSVLVDCFGQRPSRPASTRPALSAELICPDGRRSGEFLRDSASFADHIRLREKFNLLSRFKLIWVVQSPLQKYFA